MKNKQNIPDFFKSILSICVIGIALFYSSWAFCGKTHLYILRSQNSAFAQSIFLFLRPWLPLLIASVFGFFSARFFNAFNLKKYLKMQTLFLLLPSILGVLIFLPLLSFFAIKHNFEFGFFDTLPKDFSLFFVYKNFFTHISDLTGADACFFVGIFGVLFYFFTFSTFFAILAHFFAKKQRNENFSISTFALFLIFAFSTALLWLLPRNRIFGFNFSKIFIAWFLGFFVLSHAEVLSALKNIRHWLVSLGIALGIYYVYIETNGVFSSLATKALESLFGMIGFCGIYALTKRYFDKPSVFKSTFAPLFFISFYFCQIFSVLFACLFLKIVTNPIFAFFLTLFASLTALLCVHLIFKKSKTLQIYLGKNEIF